MRQRRFIIVHVILSPTVAVSDDVIAAAFRDAGAQVRVERAGTDASAVELARSAAQEPDKIVVAGGGDGTVGAVAGEVVRAGKILGVLPLGTLNHFAKDMGIPLDLPGAVRTIVSGQSIAVDVGEVNGKVFLNNSSLGIYPHIVQRREAQQTRLGRGKWPAFARAALDAVRRYPFLHLRITVDGRPIDRKTAFLFLGNNEYEFTGLRAGGRACLNAGHLGLYLAHRTGRLGMLRLAFRALFGRLGQARDFENFCVDEALVETGRSSLLVATDGEVQRMSTPLHFRSRPGALRVRTPGSSSSS